MSKKYVKERLATPYGVGSLMPEAILDIMKDFPIEKGNGHRKFESGLMIQWGLRDNPIYTEHASGSIFISNDVENIFPIRFVGDSPMVFTQLMTGSTVAWSQTRSTSVTRFYYTNNSPLKHSSSSIPSKLFWLAIGKHK